MAKEPITNPQTVRAEYYKSLNNQYDGNPPDGGRLTLHNLMKFSVKCEGTTLTNLATLKDPPIKDLRITLNEANQHSFLTEEVSWLQNWLETKLQQPKYDLIPTKDIVLDDLFATKYSKGQVVSNPNHVKNLYENDSQHIKDTATGLIHFVALCEGEALSALAREKNPQMTSINHKLSSADKLSRFQFNKNDVKFLHNWLVAALDDEKYSKLEAHEKPTPDQIATLLMDNMGKQVNPQTLHLLGVSPDIVEGHIKN